MQIVIIFINSKIIIEHITSHLIILVMILMLRAVCHLLWMVILAKIHYLSTVIELLIIHCWSTYSSLNHVALIHHGRGLLSDILLSQLIA